MLRRLTPVIRQHGCRRRIRGQPTVPQELNQCRRVGLHGRGKTRHHRTTLPAFSKTRTPRQHLLKRVGQAFRQGFGQVSHRHISKVNFELVNANDSIAGRTAVKHGRHHRQQPVDHQRAKRIALRHVQPACREGQVECQMIDAMSQVHRYTHNVRLRSRR
nr:hypothetical protein [Pandoraea iniqua]